MWEMMDLGKPAFKQYDEKKDIWICYFISNNHAYFIETKQPPKEGFFTDGELKINFKDG